MASLSDDEIKDLLGKKAAELPKSGMVIGLGTGTTTHHFILHLGARCRAGLSITAVASSERSEKLAKEQGIPLVSIDTVSSIDLTVDGADEIDKQKRMIKGGGGALLREKIVAFASRRVVIIADASKAVEHLGSRRLPVEVVPFAHELTRRHIEDLGLSAAWRMNNQEKLWKSDNGNYILDIAFPGLLKNPEIEECRIVAIPGIVETGFFFDLADEALIGHPNGQITSI